MSIRITYKSKTNMKKTSAKMRTIRLCAFIFALSSLSFSASLLMAQSRFITYQGSVNEANGTPATGDHTLTVSLYSDVGGNLLVWKGSYQQMLINGIFSVALGSAEHPLPADLDFSKPLWVGVSIDNGAELTPYTQLTGSPYSLSIPDNSVTKDKMATDYVGAISINGKKVTAKGSELNISTGNGIFAEYDDATNSLLFKGIFGGGNQNPQAIFFNGCGGNVDGAPGVLTNFIGGGSGNVANAAPGAGCFNGFASIVGGQGNTAGAIFASIGGGVANQSLGTHSAISGGNTNVINPSHSFIGGGWQNNVMGTEEQRLAVIGGGSSNKTHGFAAAIIGGGSNHAFADFATIGGGDFNLIEPLAAKSFIGGGRLNHIGIEAEYGTIAGGEENAILSGNVDDIAHHNTISGGRDNQIDKLTSRAFSFNAHASTIGGGMSNRIQNNRSVIGGGNNNEIYGGTSTIAGGTHNTIYGPSTSDSDAKTSDFSIISGGALNTTLGFNNTIIGGAENISVLAHQIIGGYINDTSHNYGGFPSTMSEAALASFPPSPANAITPTALSAKYDAPLFALGNGEGSFFNRATPHNAFEVSYNGHSVVYDINGTGQKAAAATATPGRAAIAGATYEDNIIYAWGEVDELGQIVSDFGVYRTFVSGSLGIPCTHPSLVVVLNQVHPDNPSLQRVFTEGSVTVTLQAPVIGEPTEWYDHNTEFRACRHLTVYTSKLFAFRDPMDNNQVHTAFKIFVDEWVGDGECGPCKNVLHPLTFKVTGRRKAEAGGPQ